MCFISHEIYEIYYYQFFDVWMAFVNLIVFNTVYIIIDIKKKKINKNL